MIVFILEDQFYKFKLIYIEKKIVNSNFKIVRKILIIKNLTFKLDEKKTSKILTKYCKRY